MPRGAAVAVGTLVLAPKEKPPKVPPVPGRLAPVEVKLNPKDGVAVVPEDAVDFAPNENPLKRPVVDVEAVGAAAPKVNPDVAILNHR